MYYQFGLFIIILLDYCVALCAPSFLKVGKTSPLSFPPLAPPDGLQPQCPLRGIFWQKKFVLNFFGGFDPPSSILWRPAAAMAPSGKLFVKKIFFFLGGGYPLFLNSCVNEAPGKLTYIDPYFS